MLQVALPFMNTMAQCIGEHALTTLDGTMAFFKMGTFACIMYMTPVLLNFPEQKNELVFLAMSKCVFTLNMTVRSCSERPI